MKPIPHMTVQELVNPFASLMISHPHLVNYMTYAQELARRNKILVDAINLLEPGDRPCDCCINHDGIYWQECQCGNGGDLAKAHEWCMNKNAYERTLLPALKQNRGES